MLALAIIPVLSSCSDKADVTNSNNQRSQGRFAGVGVYDAGELWGKMADAPNPANPQAANIRDDEHVIVVVDTRTGEIRQCGDHSGYCVGISPWAAAKQVPVLPAKLSAHRHDASVAEIPDHTANATK